MDQMRESIQRLLECWNLLTLPYPPYRLKDYVIRLRSPQMVLKFSLLGGEKRPVPVASLSTYLWSPDGPQGYDVWLRWFDISGYIPDVALAADRFTRALSVYYEMCEQPVPHDEFADKAQRKCREMLSEYQKRLELHYQQLSPQLLQELKVFHDMATLELPALVFPGEFVAAGEYGLHLYGAIALALWRWYTRPHSGWYTHGSYGVLLSDTKLSVYFVYSTGGRRLLRELQNREFSNPNILASAAAQFARVLRYSLPRTLFFVRSIAEPDGSAIIK